MSDTSPEQLPPLAQPQSVVTKLHPQVNLASEKGKRKGKEGNAKGSFPLHQQQAIFRM